MKARRMERLKILIDASPRSWTVTGGVNARDRDNRTRFAGHTGGLESAEAWFGFRSMMVRPETLWRMNPSIIVER
jgi:hypothetical protein